MAVSSADLDNMAWTMLGEAWPGDIAGMTAVGSVINNRFQSGRYGSSITHVVKAPNQFATWGIGSQAQSQGNNPDQRFSTMSPQFQQARALAEQIVSGQVADPTGGAVEYRQTGTTRRQGTDIGGNTFFAPSASALGYASSGKSPQITAIQQQLANAGYNPGPIDGINGPKTKAAVRAFQQANGLTADGIVGPQTSAVMAAMSAPAFNPLPAPLPLVPPQTTFGGRLPAQAQYGIDRLVPGKVTQPPTDFNFETGMPDLRTLGMTGMRPNLAAGLSAVGGVTGGAPPLPIPRPAGAPPAPVQAAPPQLPTQRPSAPVAPPAAPQTVLTANGNRVSIGLHDMGDHSVMVSDDGTGHARIERLRGPMAIPGVLDPMREANADTIAGGMIRKMIPQGAAEAASYAPAAVDNIKAGAIGAVNNLGSSLGGMFGGLGGLFAPKTPIPTFAQLQAIRSVPANSYYRPAPMPVSRAPSFFAQPQAAAPRSVMPAPMPTAIAAQRSAQNNSSYFGGTQGAINDTLRTLGFNV